MPRNRPAVFSPRPEKFCFSKSRRGTGHPPRLRHLFPGWDVPIYYDPILAKLIVWAEDRETACRRMTAALGTMSFWGFIRPSASSRTSSAMTNSGRAGRRRASSRNILKDWKEKEPDPEIAPAGPGRRRLSMTWPQGDAAGRRCGPGSERRRRSALEDIGAVEDRRSRVSWNLSFSSTALRRKISLEKKENDVRYPGWRAVLETEIRPVSENELVAFRQAAGPRGSISPGTEEPKARFYEGAAELMSSANPGQEAGRSLGRG